MASAKARGSSSAPPADSAACTRSAGGAACRVAATASALAMACTDVLQTVTYAAVPNSTRAHRYLQELRIMRDRYGYRGIYTALHTQKHDTCRCVPIYIYTHRYIYIYIYTPRDARIYIYISIYIYILILLLVGTSLAGMQTCEGRMRSNRGGCIFWRSRGFPRCPKLAACHPCRSVLSRVTA